MIHTLILPKKNHLYALRSPGDQERSPNVVTGMLQVFSIYFYALLDPGATLSFITPLAAMRFDILCDVFHELFWFVPRWVILYL